MKIAAIGHKLINTSIDNTIIIFENDEDLRAFLTKLLELDVKSGARVLPLICDYNKMPLMARIGLDLLETVDGINENNKDSMIDTIKDKITAILKENT